MKKLGAIANSQHRHLFSIYTHLTKHERILLFELAKSLPLGSTIVEIGSYLGASTCFLAAGARSRGNKVYAVDTWTNIGMSEGARDTYEEFLRNTEPLREWIVPLRGLSTEVGEKFDGRIDLLFIDGNHSYEAVRADLEVWLLKVKDGGIVVFHDYNWAEGVQRSVRELIVPIQVEGGRRIDSIYWTRISHQEKKRWQMTLRASVIIPTYSRLSYLKDAIQSIQIQDFANEQYEILVVDNGPSAEAKSIVDEVNQNGSHPVRYVRESQVGLHNARHAGAREAKGEILVYVDDDVIVHPDWLTAMIAPFADPQVACVGGKVIPRWEEVKPPNWELQFPPGYLSLLDMGEEPKELHWPEGAYGCNMAVRRSVLYEVGGFNPDGMGDRRLIWLRGDGETGLHKKIFDAGYRVIYTPHGWLYHRIPASRLTSTYFHWRAFIQGISDSYTHVRQYPSKRRMLRHGAGCFLRALRCYIRSVGSRYNEQTRRDAWYWYGRGQHQIRTALSGTLYQHVLQDTYLVGSKTCASVSSPS